MMTHSDDITQPDDAVMATCDAPSIAFEEIQIDVDQQGAIDQRPTRLLGGVLTMFVVLSIVPVGSNRPIFWMINAAIIGLIAVVYFGDQCLRRRPVVHFSGDHRYAVACGAAVIVWGVFQALPTGLGAGGVMTHLPDQMRPHSLSVDRGASLLAMIRFGAYIVFFVLCVEAAGSGRRIKSMAWGLYWGMFAHAVWGIAALVFMDDYAPWGQKTDYLGVATGTFVNRNSFATFLGMALCLGIALTLSHARSTALRRGGALVTERKLELCALWTSVAIIAVTLLATQSRMGAISAVVGGWVVVMIFARQQGWASGRGSTLVFGAAFVLVTATGAGTIESFLFTEQSAATRIALYTQIVHAILARPFLGYGLDSFALVYELIHKPPVPTHLVWDLAHSTYLAMWLELGIVFGTLPMIAVALCARVAIRNAIQRSSAYAVPAAAVGATVVAALHSTIDFSLEISGNVFVVIMLLAMGSVRLGRDAR